jgi:hypothetical protein
MNEIQLLYFDEVMILVDGMRHHELLLVIRCESVEK